MKFKYTILYVDDVAATLHFFETAFGMPCSFLHDSGDYGELETGSTKLAFSSLRLMKDLVKSPAAALPSAPVFEIAFETDDVAGALKKAIAAGAKLQ